MAHKGQKRLNKIATNLINNEVDMGYRFWERTSIEDMRKFVKKNKLHYSLKMMEKAKKRGNW